MTRLSCHLPSFLLAASLTNDFFVSGVIMSLEGLRRASGIATHGLATRAGVVDLQNSGDLEFYMNVTLGGRSIRVLMDSGSADFWVAGEIPEAAGTPHAVAIHYQDNTVGGQVNQSTLEIGGATIVNQTFVAQPVDTLHPDGQGILGIGPTSLSSIAAAIPAPAGNPVIDNLIALQGSGSEYVTTLISRPNNDSDVISTQLTVGEVLSDYEDVHVANRLDVSKSGWDSHWMVALDDGGIVSPDGKMVKASEGTQLKVVFDSGYTMAQVPSDVAEAIYSRVPGAKLTTIEASPSPAWTMPCNIELNVTFKFGGVSYPIHPLDTVMNDVTGPLDSNGVPSCVGAFQPSTSSTPYDILLGMTFLRNTYLLMNIGDQPYLQLLSLTNPAQAHEEFVQQRLGGVDTTGSQQLLPDTAGLSDISKPPTTVQKYKSFIIAGTVIGAFILLCVLGILTVWYRKRRYQRLHAPAPEGALQSRGPQSSAWKEFKEPEPKPRFKVLSLGLSGRSRSLTGAHGPLPDSYGQDSNASTRKKNAGDLVPNRRSKTQSMLAVARQPSFVEEGAALLGNAAVVGVTSPPASYSSHSSVYSQEDGPILVIGEKPLPNPHESETSASEERDVTSPRADDEEDRELPLITPAEYKRHTYGAVEPQTPATPRPPARADTPDPYDLPPLPATVPTPAPLPAKATHKHRPLPTPQPVARSSSKAQPLVLSAFESMSHRAAPGRSKMHTLPTLDISSTSLGMGSVTTSQSSKSSRSDSSNSRS
ncbi:aspartic peptidase domain-containing protein [Dichomitus squalens]|uniref:Aspartic peptidase domain-containing protein n=1 Tax=Dichomitus squalens TaxID=114155 RepID=A0A4V2K7K0_9APHY|nr:aspartic peptidase domain-containing protein [Dichomitus squalens]